MAPQSLQQSAMRAGDRAENRYNCRREQDGMCAPKAPQDASGIVRASAANRA